jgi:hypothetical protein
MIASATRVFVEEMNAHARHGACDACSGRPTLLTPAHRQAVAA